MYFGKPMVWHYTVLIILCIPYSFKYFVVNITDYAR